MGKFRSQDWFAVGVELAVLVLGIVLGLQAADWSDARRERVEEKLYLERLLANNASNREALRQSLDSYRTSETSILSISNALVDSNRVPDRTLLDRQLCRWFVAVDLRLQRATYAELVSSGKLLLVQDQQLRVQLASEEAAHLESRRLDILTPAIQRALEPIDPYRSWYIDSSKDPAATRCRFDVDGMRRDPLVGSALAQLYRNASLYAEFRQQEIDAVDRTRKMLVKALDHRP